MRKSNKFFPKTIKVYFVRYCFICILGALVGFAFITYPGIDGWFFYRTGWEVFCSVARLAVAAVVVGFLVGAAVTGVAALLQMVLGKGRRGSFRLVERGLVLLMVLAGGSLFLRNILIWFVVIGFNIPTRLKFGVWLVVLGIVAILLAKKARRERMLTVSGKLFTSAVTRRSVIALGGAAAAVAAVDGVFSGEIPLPPGRKQKGHPDILLVTFDAMNAEDLPLYGYRLPTAPHIGRFAETATVFRQYYSCSTFTTPSVAAFSSGRYPSNIHVNQLGGALRGEDRVKTLPYVLHQNGYETAASVANPWAHPAITRVGGYDVAPAPPVRDAFIRGCFQYREADFSCETIYIKGLVNHQLRRIRAVLSIAENRFGPPEDSFAQAAALWHGLRSPKFLHVHVLAPHHPYQPGRCFLGRFVKADEKLAPFVEHFIHGYNGCPVRYSLTDQRFFDQFRFRYDEWIANADAAFGGFLSDLKVAGELKNTIVTVSADHGESFQGGVWGHGGPSMLRSIVHIPFVVHMPGQTEGREISHVADAASLAPTLLDLAGLSVPSWMDGVSLRPVIDDPKAAGSGYAFSQYLERNSTFKPITTGTIGVVDGEHQYIVEVATGKGSLYELVDAHLHSREISVQQTAIARALRERIRARFPTIPISA